MNKDLYLPHDRYIAALQRQRQRVVDGVPLVAYDDTTPGDKSTSCSWGLCSEEKAAWPDAQDHLWPDQFTAHGRVAPKYLSGAKCPFDKRTWSPSLDGKDMNGCFYTCMVFKANKKNPVPSKEETIALYDLLIKRVTTK